MLGGGLAGAAMSECNQPSIAKCILIGLGFLTTLSWIWGLFFFPDAWNGVDGKNYLFFLMAVSALHFPIGFVLIAASIYRILRFRFGIVVCVAPVFHCMGSPMEYPLYLLLFILPTVAIFLFGLLELRYSPPPQVLDVEP
jgi:hypothetical protein